MTYAVVCEMNLGSTELRPPPGGSMDMTYLILSRLTNIWSRLPNRSHCYPFSMKNFIMAMTCCVL